jgi:hypothetical protein
VSTERRADALASFKPARGGLAIAWRTRATPLPPAAAIACDDVAERLCVALLSRTDDALAKLHGVAGVALIVVSGAPDDLPWVDGLTYLGRDPDAPALLVPTTLTTAPHIALLEKALLAAYGALPPPLAILPQPARMIPLGAARPIARARLRSWADGER